MTEPRSLSSDEIWQNILAEHEHDLKIPKGVIWSLRDEPDHWTFFIKAHALIESALTMVLIAQDKRLADVLEALPLSHTKYGKVTTARAMGILDQEDVAFVEIVQRVRNILVHDIRNVAFDFKKYFASLTAKQRRQIADVLLLRFQGQPHDSRDHGRQHLPAPGLHHLVRTDSIHPNRHGSPPRQDLAERDRLRVGGA